MLDLPGVAVVSVPTPFQVRTPTGRPIVEGFRSHYERQRSYFDELLPRMGVPEKTVEVVIELPETYAKLAPPVEVARPLAPGAVLNVGLPLECVDSQGHAPGSLSFAVAGGDSIFTGDHVLADITPNPTLQVPSDGEERPRSTVWPRRDALQAGTCGNL